MFPLKDSIRIATPPVAVYVLILVNAVVFIYQSTLTSRASYLFSIQHALVPVRYFNPEVAANLFYGYGLEFVRGDYWPLITGTFMHGGWWHILLNMWTLYIFGASLEGRLGRLPFLTFYLVCGVIASFTHAWFNADSTVPALGASGAIAGVLGGYAATFPRARVTLVILIVIIPFFFKIPAIGFAAIWFALQFMTGLMDWYSDAAGGGIAWWAHIGGFIAGVALVPFWRFRPDRTTDVQTLSQPGISYLPPPRQPWRGPWE